ncbi:Shedu anti-phage system protein SduA domain-containing protein [Promicromonospora sp. NPDC090134]|uniref:Shedu anti-phage system protein SduA domain-containing protein n=1 Tax=Promicromonospora sp. NPDC090134 TaxID=3364408 RepID=UPI0037F6CB45
MTTYRSSFTLRRLLEETRELTVHEDVGHQIDAALKIIDEPSSVRYGRGKPLVLALEQVGRIAFRHEEWEIVDRVQRFADYAAGELPLSILEMHYDNGARSRQEQFMRSMASLGAQQAVSALDVLCEGHPDATASDAREFFRGIARSMDSVSIGSGDGGVRLSPQDADRLLWIGRMELVVRDLQSPVSSETADLLDDLLTNPEAGALAQLVELRSRRVSLDALRAVVDEPTSSEGALHACLKSQDWIFGGAYVGELVRRQYAPDAILDIPLLRGDGSLHVIELKRANIKDLLVRRSGHVMLGASVHHAVSQAENYLRTLDEAHGRILAEHGIETRRASATVVIGHPKYLHANYSSDEVADTLRTYNSHLARLEVITYEMLLDSATRMLALSSPEKPDSQSK